MELKQSLQQFKRKIKSVWNSGKIQRAFRMTYDVMWNVFLFFIVIGLISLFFGFGIGAGYFASLVKDEPIRSYESMKQDIYNYEETSKLYFADNVYIGDIRTDLHREEISLDQISQSLIDAVIATEDEYFHEHKGIVPKAIVRAVLQEATDADVKTGGSTLTQQLIKNQMLTNEVSFERKAKEILLALRLERFFDKEEILEAYLNVVPFGRDSSGRNIAGIQTAAQGIFGVDAKDLNLAQSAYLAGLPQSPSAYTPYVNTGGLKNEEHLQPGIKRMETVLRRMYNLDYITETEYKEALQYDIVADFQDKKESPTEKYPYITYELQDRAVKVLAEVMAKEDGYTMKELNKDKELRSHYEELAKRDLPKKGYHIHSTIDKEIYDMFQQVVKNYPHFGPDRTTVEKNEETGKTEEIIDPVQTGGILIENKTGRIISFVGGREYSENKQLNFATNAVRQNGSTMKPLLVYAPAMEKGVIQPGSPIADIPLRGDKSPKNYGDANYGLVSAREALAKSYNRPAFNTYLEIIHDNPAKEYLEKMGFSTLTKTDYQTEALSLGGMSKGVSVEENTNAFATFANGGDFVDAYMIEKITTPDGEIIYEHEPEPVEVFSPQTAYLTIDMMRSVIHEGTATFLNSQLKHGSVDWAGKTGTTNEYRDAWFVATNPNVTFGTWIGYDSNESLDYCPGCSLSYSQRNMKLWAELINAASDINPELVAPNKHFERPEGIVERSYCAISGLLPSKLCEQAGMIRTDLFNAKFVPTKVDDSLLSASGGLVFNPEFLKRNGYDQLSDLSMLLPRSNRKGWEKKINNSGKVDKKKESSATPSQKKTGGQEERQSESKKKNEEKEKPPVKEKQPEKKKQNDKKQTEQDKPKEKKKEKTDDSSKKEEQNGKKKEQNDDQPDEQKKKNDQKQEQKQEQETEKENKDSEKHEDTDSSTKDESDSDNNSGND